MGYVASTILSIGKQLIIVPVSEISMISCSPRRKTRSRFSEASNKLKNLNALFWYGSGKSRPARDGSPTSTNVSVETLQQQTNKRRNNDGTHITSSPAEDELQRIERASSYDSLNLEELILEAEEVYEHLYGEADAAALQFVKNNMPLQNGFRPFKGPEVEEQLYTFRPIIPGEFGASKNRGFGIDPEFVALQQTQFSAKRNRSLIEMA